MSDYILEPQEEGGFVAKSKKHLGAIGQGETEEEAIRDLEEAIESLKDSASEGEWIALEVKKQCVM